MTKSRINSPKSVIFLSESLIIYVGNVTLIKPLKLLFEKGRNGPNSCKCQTVEVSAKPLIPDNNMPLNVVKQLI